MFAKGKIDEVGHLQIERAGKLQEQLCPSLNQSRHKGHCGDWCPHFGEPLSTMKNIEGKPVDVVILDICKKSFITFKKFTDERRPQK